MRSLEAFIEENGQWERAARRLYCHRHTLRYRIRRVEELTGRNLGQRRDRIEFWLALRGRQLVVESESDEQPEGGPSVKVGVPTEVKTDEYRVALTPAGVRELVDAGHEVFVQSGAGLGSAIPDEAYAAPGRDDRPRRGRGVRGGDADRQGQGAPAARGRAAASRATSLFTYLHLAADAALTRGLMESGATCIAYETVEDARGRLPLLAPMSEVAGKIATQAGAFMLEKPLGGRGILLGGVPGVAAANVMIIGGGVVGMQRGVHRDRDGGDRVRLRPQPRPPARARHRLRRAGRTRASRRPCQIEERLPYMDLVIGAVLVHGARAPHVITRAQLGLMKHQAVLVDVSIDQGGCFETSRPTTHSDPTYEVDGITHYCVTNMPGAVPITSTYALDQRHDAVRPAPGLRRASRPRSPRTPG